MVSLVIGLATMMGGFYYIYCNHSFAQTAIKTTGQITKITKKSSGENNSYDVYITFKTSDGRKIDFRSNFYSSKMRVGNDVAILYDPQNPQNARQVNGLIFVSIFLVLFGFVFFAAGFVELIIKIRLKNLLKGNKYE
jgi:hypothetical protein